MATTEEDAARLSAALEQNKEAFERLTGVIIGQSEEQLRATKAEKDAKESAAAFKAKMDMASEAAKALAGAFVNYNKEVYKSGNANKAAAASIDSMGEAAKYAGAFLALLVPGGPLVKGLVAGIGLLTSELIKSGKLIAEQTDEIYKAYQDMARAGATGAGGMQDVFDSLQKVGLGTEKFGAYLKLVNENANDLAMFGGTVRSGRKEFEKTMGSFTAEQRVQMQQMGLDREAQADATMAYIKQQRLLTMGTKSQMDTSSAAVMRYIKETDELTRITGANREEQQKLLDKAMSEEIFASFLDELESQGEEGKKRAAVIRANNVAAEKLLGPETARGIRDSLTGFVGASQASQKAFMSSNGAVLDYADRVKNTTMTQEEGLKEFGKLNKSIADVYTNQQRGLAQMGVTEGIYGRVAENRRAVAVEQLGIEKSLLKADQERKDALANPETRKMAEIAERTAEQQLQLQRGVNLGMTAYINGLDKVSSANTTALNTLGDAALKAAEYLGIIGGGKRVQQSAKVQEAKAATDATRTAAEPLRKKVDDLNAQIDAEEKQLLEAKRAGKSVAEMKTLEDKIAQHKAEYAKTAEELDREEKKIKDAALKEREIRQKQVAELGKLNRLEEQNRIELERLGTLKEARYDAEKAASDTTKSAAEIASAKARMAKLDKSIVESETKVKKATDEISVLRKTLAPAAAGGAAPASGGGGAAAPASGGAAGTSPMTSGPAPTATGGAGKAEVKPNLDVQIGDELRKGGTVSWRTNNPGNISYADITKKHGALAPFINPNGDLQQRTVGIAVMPSLEAGEMAQMELWRRPLYNNRTIAGAANMWTKGVASEEATSYGRDLANAAGADINSLVSSLTDDQLRKLVQKQKVWEGFKEGTVVKAADGGMFSGPRSGYPALLHGNEAVIPLKGGAVPVQFDTSVLSDMTGLRQQLEKNPSESSSSRLTGFAAGDSTSFGNLIDIMRQTQATSESLVAAMSEMVRAQKNSNDIQSKMLSYAQN